MSDHFDRGHAELLNEFFTGYRQSAAGTGYCLDDMIPTMEELGFSKGVEVARQAKQVQQMALEKKYAWDKKKQMDALARQGTKKLDDEIDRMLSNFLQGLQSFANFPEGSDKKRMADEIIGEFFPEGVYFITSKKFTSQHAHVERLLERLKSGYTDELETLGFMELVEKLEEVNDDFGDKLSDTGPDVSYDEVQAAEQEANEALHHVLATVLAEYADDMATLNRVLEPYYEMNKRIRRHMKRRGTRPEVDPETGEPVDESDAPADGGSPEVPEETGESDETTSDGDGSGSGDNSSGDGESDPDDEVSDSGDTDDGESDTDETN